jgi:hypothetical protein
LCPSGDSEGTWAFLFLSLPPLSLAVAVPLCVPADDDIGADASTRVRQMSINLSRLLIYDVPNKSPGFVYFYLIIEKVNFFKQRFNKLKYLFIAGRELMNTG